MVNFLFKGNGSMILSYLIELNFEVLNKIYYPKPSVDEKWKVYLDLYRFLLNPEMLS
jgi:hypothetical protein